MKRGETYNLIIRYLILVLLGLFSLLGLFYFIFTSLTVYPVFWIISIFDNGAKLLIGNLLFFKGVYAEISAACVAGAAYYLLLILNLTTPMNINKRIKSIVFLLLIFLLLNIARILFFAGLLVSGSQYFDATHTLVWYFGSTILVVLVWFINVLYFKIKAIPIYTDIKNIFSDVSKFQINPKRGAKKKSRKFL